MVVPEAGRVNGTYHAAQTMKERVRRTRLLIAISAAIAALAGLNVVLINADMSRMEQAGPQRLALAGGGIDHFIPSILLNLQRAQQSANTVTLILADDPRHSLPYVEDKRALERWLALTGFGLAALFVGLENRIPVTTSGPRPPTGADLSRMLILLSLSYGALSIFEGG
jgi:hypothetical protein